MFRKRALWLVAFLRKETCNWARVKRRSFSPGAAARHRGLSHCRWWIQALIFHFLARNWMSQTSDLKSDVATRHALADRTSAISVLFRRPIRNLTSPKMTSPIWNPTLKSDVLASPFPLYFHHFFWDRTSPHFEIGHWSRTLKSNLKKKYTSDLKKRWETGLAQMRRACGPAPVARGGLRGESPSACRAPRDAVHLRHPASCVLPMETCCA